MEAALEKRLKRQVIGKPHLFLAVVPLGFEQTLVEELTSISQENSLRHPEPRSGEGFSQESIAFHVIGDGKVEFTAKITDAWKAVACTRIANRILMHIADFKAENFRELEKKASEIPWELYLPSAPANPDSRHTAVPLSLRHTEARSASVSTPSNSELGTGNSLSIHVTCKHSRLYHSDAIAERLYNVINTCHPREGGDLPAAATSSWRPQSRHSLASSASPSAVAPPQNLYVNFLDDRCTLWLDLAGEELYKRGHERHVNDAPLKETIAAGMLFEVSALVAAPITLIDPMAGSGTFSLEAAYMASGLIPGVCRDFALKHQPAFKPATWNHIVNSELSLRGNNATAAITDVTPKRETSPIVTPKRGTSPIVTPKREAQVCPSAIITSDISERAISIIRHNVECSPLASAPQGGNAPAIAPQLKDFFNYTAEEIANACPAGTQPAMVLNPPYGKRLDCDAPKLYTQIGQKLAELARSLKALGKTLSVAILAPKDDTRGGAKYTCTANLLRECPALDPATNTNAKRIVTSHGGFTLNAFFAKL